MIDFKNELNIFEVEGKEIMDDFLGESVPFDLERLENEAHDASFFIDKHLHAIVDDLTYNDISETDIIEMNNRSYGTCIDIYHVNEMDCYVLAIVNR